MNDYEIAVRKWAYAKLLVEKSADTLTRLGVSGPEGWRKITRVEIAGDSGSPAYSSWTPGGDPSFRVVAHLDVAGYATGYPIIVADWGDETIDFSTLLGEVLAVPITDSDRELA